MRLGEVPLDTQICIDEIQVDTQFVKVRITIGECEVIVIQSVLCGKLATDVLDLVPEEVRDDNEAAPLTIAEDPTGNGADNLHLPRAVVEGFEASD